MRRLHTKRKCKHCQTFFVPDPRCVRRQRYCSTPACRQASKTASQRRWHHKPANRDYFTGPTEVERVRAWRQAHPGYWRRQASRPAPALQDPLTSQSSHNQSLDDTLAAPALQDDFFLQPAVFVGLIAHLTGLTLQEDIATTTRRLQQLGRDILASSPPYSGGMPNAQTPHLSGATAASAQAVQLGRSAPGP
jgi:hypothetical protein